MPTRVLLEGPAIEPLLAQVRQQYGPHARIISADKIRTGGLGGFFARQRYELSVEVDDEPAAPAADHRPAALESGRAGNAAPAGRRPAPGNPGTGPGRPAAGYGSTVGNGTVGNGSALDNGPAAGHGYGPGNGSAVGYGSALGNGSALSNGSALGDTGAAGGPALAGTVGTAGNGTAYGALGNGAARAGAAGSGAARTGANGSTARPGYPAGPAGEPPVDGLLALVEASQDRYQGGSAEAAAGLPAAGVATIPGSAPNAVTPRAGLVSTNNPGFAEVLAGLRGGLSGGPVGVDADLIDEATHGTLDGGHGPRNGATGLGPATGTTGATDGHATPRIAVPTRSERTVRAYQAPVLGDDDPAGTGPNCAGLAALGVPAPLARKGTGAHPYQAALEALDDLPEPPAPPNRPGDVLVVAGELAYALPVARQVAEELHLDPKKIGLVAPSAAGTGIHPARRISGPADAERRARRMHRADVPHVVVMDLPVGAKDDGWHREVCDALGASAVWAVVDATRKTADSARRLEALGEVDGIALYGAAATADPASALSLPAPIALLDGQPATTHAWAALLAERLQQAARKPRRGRRQRRAEG